MKLILCKLSVDVVIYCDDDSTVGENVEAAERFAQEEVYHLECGPVELITSLAQLPPKWRDALPYRDPNVGPELTCRQILEGKS